MWAYLLGIIGLILALGALFVSILFYGKLSVKLDAKDAQPLFDKFSSEILRESEKRSRGLETEWTEMYQKFTRIAGRIDREKALAEPSKKEDSPTATSTLTRSDIVRKWRSNEQTSRS